MKKIISIILAVSMLLSMSATALAGETEGNLTADNVFVQTNFPITEETGANSKHFLADGATGDNNGDTYSDFINMLDFGGYTKRYSADDATAAGYTSGVGYYPTHPAEIVNENIGAVVYTVDNAEADNSTANTIVNLTSKDNNKYWNIGGVDYALNTEGKAAIKLLQHVRTELITDTAVAEKMDTLNGLTFDVVDGYYDSVGFLIGTNSRDSRTLYYKLIYEDGTDASTALSGILDPLYSVAVDDKHVSDGFIYAQAINPTGEEGENRSARGNRTYAPYTIDTDPTRKLKAIELTAHSDWSAIYIVSSWGESATPTALLSEYTTDTAVTEENAEDVQLALDNVDLVLAAKGLTSEDLVDTKAVYDALTAGLATYEANLNALRLQKGKKINFPVSEATGANAQLFIQYSSDKYKNSADLDGDDFIVGIDYLSTIKYDSAIGGNYVYPTGVFATDIENCVLPRAFVYTEDDETPVSSIAHFTTVGADKIWTIDDVDYIINPDEKVFSLFNNNKLDNITDASIKAKFESVQNGLTFDVPDGNYTKVGFLAGAGYGRTTYVTLNYSDNTTEALSFATPNKIETATVPSTGKTAFRYLSTQEAISFIYQPYTVEADPEKTLVSITLKAATYRGENPVSIISAWGEEKSATAILADYADVTEITKDNYETAKADLAKVDEILEENGCTVADLGESKAIYDTVAVAITAYEATMEEEAEKEKFTKNEQVDLALTGANSTLFLPAGTDLGDLTDPANTNYTNGTYDYINDFRQTYWYSSDAVMGLNSADTESKDKDGSSPFYKWSHSFIADSNVPADENGNVTLKYLTDSADITTAKDITYNIKTDKKVIQLAGLYAANQKLSTAAEEAYRAKFNALKTAEIAVNGNYKNIYLLAHSTNGQTISSSKVNIYYKGEEEPVQASLTFPKTSDLVSIYNLIEGKTHTSIWEFAKTTGYMGASFYTCEIPCDYTKEIEKIELAFKDVNRQFFVISATGEKASLADIIGDAGKLEITKDNYQDAETIVAQIKAKIESVGADLAYDADLKAIIDGMEADIQAAKDAKEAERLHTSRDVNLELNGNSSVFAPYQTNLGDLTDPSNEIYTTGGYDYVLDFRQEGWYNTTTKMGVDAEDSELYKWPHKFISYKYADAATSMYLPLTEDNKYTIPYLDGEEVKHETYVIDPTKKVLHIAAGLLTKGQDLTDKAQEAYGEKLKSLENVTLNVPADFYTGFTILATNNNGQAINDAFNADIYYEGQTEPERVSLSICTTAQLLANYNKITGTEKASIWEHSSATGYAGVAWYSYTIPCDSTRKVEKIDFSIDGGNRNVIIAAVNGKKASVAEAVADLDSVTNTFNYKLQEAKVAAIEVILEEGDFDITKDAVLNATLNQIKADIEAFNEIKSTLGPVSNTTVRFEDNTVVVKLDIINPSALAEKPFTVVVSYINGKKVAFAHSVNNMMTDSKEVYSTEVDCDEEEDTASVKAFVWQDLATIKPISAPASANK